MTDLKKVDVMAFLSELGMKNIRRDRVKYGYEIRFSCPFPGHAHGDSTPSATMNEETTAYRCWSCGMKGNAISFLAELMNISPLLAARFIRERFEGGWKPVSEDGLQAEIMRILFREIEDYEPPPLVDAAELDAMRVDWQAVWQARADGGEVPAPLAYMLDRGFAWDILVEWEIGYDTRSGRVAIPVRDHMGGLVGFKGRAWHPEHKPKYLVLGGSQYSFEPYDATSVVFGIHNASSDGHLTVCEGELNAIAMRQKGFEDAVGISGQFLSEDQARIIRAHADRCTFLYDELERAMAAAEMLEQHMPCRVCGEHEHDPAEMRGTEIEELLSQAISPLLLRVL